MAPNLDSTPAPAAHTGPRKLISRSDLARLGGVSPAAVTQSCRFRLAAACAGTLVDLEHPATRAWLADQKARGRKRKTRDETSRRALRAKAETAKQSDVDPPREGGVPTLNGDGLAEEILDLTVREVAERFGTDRRYLNWLDAYAKREQARKSRLANEETEGSLVDRNFVHQHVFAHVSALQHRLLTDAARTITARLFPLAKSGASLEQGEREVRDQISKHLKSLKARVARALKPKPGKPDEPAPE